MENYILFMNITLTHDFYRQLRSNVKVPIVIVYLYFKAIGPTTYKVKYKNIVTLIQMGIGMHFYVSFFFFF